MMTTTEIIFLTLFGAGVYSIITQVGYAIGRWLRHRHEAKKEAGK